MMGVFSRWKNSSEVERGGGASRWRTHRTFVGVGLAVLAASSIAGGARAHPLAPMLLEIIEREGILEHVREVAPYFQERLRALSDLPIVADVRGEGLIGCIECDITSGGEESLAKDHEIGKRIDAHCHKMGLMLRPMINMCVFSPPCIIMSPSPLAIPLPQRIKEKMAPTITVIITGAMPKPTASTLGLSRNFSQAGFSFS